MLTSKHEMSQLLERLHATEARLASLEAERLQLETRTTEAQKRASRLDVELAALRRHHRLINTTPPPPLPAPPAQVSVPVSQQPTKEPHGPPPLPPSTSTAANKPAAAIHYHRAASSGSLGSSGSRIPIRRTSGGDGATAGLHRADSAGSLHRVVLTTSGAAASELLPSLSKMKPLAFHPGRIGFGNNPLYVTNAYAVIIFNSPIHRRGI